jgi:hypothetical protein
LDLTNEGKEVFAVWIFNSCVFFLAVCVGCATSASAGNINPSASGHHNFDVWRNYFGDTLAMLNESVIHSKRLPMLREPLQGRGLSLLDVLRVESVSVESTTIFNFFLRGSLAAFCRCRIAAQVIVFLTPLFNRPKACACSFNIYIKSVNVSETAVNSPKVSR